MRTDYVNACFEHLRGRLLATATPEQLAALADRAELLVDEIDAARMYRCPDLCLRIAEQLPEESASTAVSGEAAQHDLRRLIEELSDAADLRADQGEQPVYTVDDLARIFNVSTKTISRWRELGLVARRFYFEDRKRVGFLRSSVQRFVARYPQRVRRGQRFTHLSVDERDELIEHSRQLLDKGLSLTQVLRHVARQMGRSIETVRYTLKRYQREHPEERLLPRDSASLSKEARQRLLQQFRRGMSIRMLAQRNGRSENTMRRIVNSMRTEHILDLPLDYIPHEDFGKPDAESVILQPMPVWDRPSKKITLSTDLPPYLARLHETPILTREQEVHLFRKYNYLKYRASKLREQLDVRRPAQGLLNEIEDFYGQAIRVQNHLVKANLRLVVSLAKRYVTPTKALPDLISDGNMSLLRAVQRFDYARGFKFSTYATWAIVKNFSRTLSAELRQSTRFRNSLDERLHGEVDRRADQMEREAAQSRNRHVVHQILRHLDEREQTIISRRFGLDYSDEPKKLKELGFEMGVSKERIRQLESRALRNLREVARRENISLPE